MAKGKGKGEGQNQIPAIRSSGDVRRTTEAKLTDVLSPTLRRFEESF